jgi:hypothetical protein
LKTVTPPFPTVSLLHLQLEGSLCKLTTNARTRAGKEVYHYGNHPIKWVRLTGIIVAIDEFSTRRVFTVDDSSGMCIECTCPAPPPLVSTLPAHLGQGTAPNPIPLSSALAVQNRKSAQVEQGSTPTVVAPSIPWQDIDVGTVVKVKGRPGSFRGVKQVDIIKVEALRSTEQEVRCWNEALAFRKEVLRNPWVVSREAEEKCRKRAEKEKQYRGSSRKHGRHKVDKSKGMGESKVEGNIEGRRRKVGESDNSRREREKHQEEERKHDTEEGSKSDNKVNYPSMAVRRRLAGKYDALGI